MPALHGERPLLAAPAAPHCLAYLPALSQPSVVMLYRRDHAAEGRRSPGAEGGKRKRVEEGEEEEEVLVIKRHISGSEERDMVRTELELDQE